jgi:hypothetical protein
MRCHGLRAPGRALLVGVASLCLLGGAAAAQPLGRLGALGDSLSDEYGDQSFGAYARNWVELLDEAGNAELGPTAVEAGQPGGTWGEPRRTGFEEDWARSGADTADALAQGQHTGLAGGAARGVTHAVLFIGNNNFRPGFPPADNSYPYNAIYNGAWSQAQIEAHVAAGIADLRTLLAPSESAGLRLVVASPFDFGATPAVKLLFPDAARRQRVTAAVALFGEHVRALAAEQGLVFVDALAFGQAVFGTNADPRATLLVGNVAIQLGLFSGSSGDTAAFVGDGVHPHTVLQGIIANLFATALDRYLGACMPLFSESELLAHNGLAYGGADTLLAEIGPLSAFVENFAPGWSLRYWGNGSTAPTLDRVTIAIDAPPRPADVGATDFTLELWLKALPGENGSTTPCSAASDAWRVGNILVDRDVFGAGDHGDFGMSLMDRRLAFGVHNGTNGATICGSSIVDDGNWHHVAVTRRLADGQVRLFVDGAEDAAPLDGPDGDLSYRDGRVGSTWDPYLVLGAEKHDAGPAFPSFSGWLDEVRLSTTVRYAGGFAPPAAPFEVDAASAALWSFDAGTGNAICDRSGAAAGPSDGERRYGGAPAGPEWRRDSPFDPAIFTDGFQSGDASRWSATQP